MYDSRLWTGLVVALLLVAAGCAPITRMTDLEQPKAEVRGVQVTGLDFEHVALAFDLRVHNPNPVGVTLAGFDYRLLLDGVEFLRGVRDDRVTLGANADSEVRVPLSLVFADIYQSFDRLGDAEEVPYRIELGANVEMPLFGQVRVPVKEEGRIPLIKPPRISIEGLRVERLSPVGARLALELAVANPNAFFLQLDRFDYNLELNGQQWLKGATNSDTRVERKGRHIVRLPIEADFGQLGTGLLATLADGRTLDYRLDGTVQLSTGNRLIDRVSLPLLSAGRLPVGGR